MREALAGKILVDVVVPLDEADAKKMAMPSEGSAVAPQRLKSPWLIPWVQTQYGLSRVGKARRILSRHARSDASAA